MIERCYDDETLRAIAAELGEPLPAMLWNDGTHVHACEGARMVPFDPDTFLVWTYCSRDVPANAATRGGPAVAVTCPKCAALHPTAIPHTRFCAYHLGDGPCSCGADGANRAASTTADQPGERHAD